MRLAQQIALENPHVSADSVEASEFRNLAARYNVYGVPKIVVNDTVQFEGALPEPQFVQAVLGAAGIQA